MSVCPPSLSWRRWCDTVASVGSSDGGGALGRGAPGPEAAHLAGLVQWWGTTGLLKYPGMVTALSSSNSIDITAGPLLQMNLIHKGIYCISKYGCVTVHVCTGFLNWDLIPQ